MRLTTDGLVSIIRYMVEHTSQSEERLQAQWQSVAKEPIDVHIEASTGYALGTELAVLRIAYKFKEGKAVVLSDGTAIFRLEL